MTEETRDEIEELEQLEAEGKLPIPRSLGAVRAGIFSARLPREDVGAIPQWGIGEGELELEALTASEYLDWKLSNEEVNGAAAADLVRRCLRLKATGELLFEESDLPRLLEISGGPIVALADRAVTLCGYEAGPALEEALGN